MTEIKDEILAALGPLAGLFADPEVLEIMVDGPERVLVERSGRLVDAEVRFESVEAVRAVIDDLLRFNPASRAEEGTIRQIYFPGGQARGVAVLPPTALQGPCLVIRKLMNTGWISWEKLVEFGAITQEGLDFLTQAVRHPVNLLIAGGAGSGKTTMANRVAELVGPEERLVVVEKMHEMQIRHPRAVCLEAAGQTGATMDDLIRTAGMMRPDWLIIGELAGSEAMGAVEALGQGYSGMTILHANSLEDALMRLEAMCLTANLGLGLMEIRNLIAGAFQLVCYQKRLSNGRRVMAEMAEIRGVENGQYALERLFRYDEGEGRLKSTEMKPTWAVPGSTPENRPAG